MSPTRTRSPRRGCVTPARRPLRPASPSINPSDLRGLRLASRQRQLVLCLGAGVSTLGRGFDEQKRPAELEEAIRAAMLQADTYDREVFESKGVKTIWVEEFAQIPAITDAVAS